MLRCGNKILRYPRYQSHSELYQYIRPEYIHPTLLSLSQVHRVRAPILNQPQKPSHDAMRGAASQGQNDEDQLTSLIIPAYPYHAINATQETKLVSAPHQLPHVANPLAPLRTMSLVSPAPSSPWVRFDFTLMMFVWCLWAFVAS